MQAVGRQLAREEDRWFALGLADAEFRTRIVAAPIISRDTGPIRITGRVDDVEMRARQSPRCACRFQLPGPGEASRICSPDRFRGARGGRT